MPTQRDEPPPDDRRTPPPSIGVRLCSAYNALFRWRARREDAQSWVSSRLDDAAAELRYAAWRHRTTPAHLARLGNPSLEGMRVLDFGCGRGGATLYYAEQGARSVLGVDVGDDVLRSAERFRAHVDPERTLPVRFRRAEASHVPAEDGSIDLILCIDVFEHLADPAASLAEWHRVLAPGGRVLATFGPLWLHPHGIHLWEIFPAPWVHLLFPERTVVRTRHHLKGEPERSATDRTYADLLFNKMTARRFERLVRGSDLEVEAYELLAVGGVRWLARVPLLRELFASEVRCLLHKPDPAAPAGHERGAAAAPPDERGRD